MTFLQEGGHREPRQPPVGWVVSGRQSLQGLAGLHAVHVQARDLNGLTWQLLVGQVLVQETVQTLVDLLQVHLFVLQNERSHSIVCGYSGSESKGVIKGEGKQRWLMAEREKEREDKDRAREVIDGYSITFFPRLHVMRSSFSPFFTFSCAVVSCEIKTRKPSFQPSSYSRYSDFVNLGCRRPQQKKVKKLRSQQI